MTSSDLVLWLQERTGLSILSQPVLAAIAPLLQERFFPPNSPLVNPGSEPDGLYILITGHLESENLSLLPGAVINLEALLLDKTVEKSIVTLEACQFWWLAKADFTELVQKYPEISQAFSQQLAEEVKQLSSQLQFEQERSQLLRPYLIPKVKRGIIGKSSYAKRLRNQIKQAAQNPGSALIFGEPGLEKDNIASLIHFTSPWRREPAIKLDCSALSSSGAELFGRVGEKMGLLEALGIGTLILNNIQELPPELLPPLEQLLKEGIYTPVSRPGSPLGEPKSSKAKIVLISEKIIHPLDNLVTHFIKVPPLRVRKTDLEDQVNYYLTLICRRKGQSKPQITPEALRKLQAYDFPNNLRELNNLVERAIVQLGKGTVLTEEIIWPSQSKKKQFRFNLLNGYPSLRNFLRSPWWPDRLNYGFTLTAFAFIVAILFLGPQTREQNFALNFFWAWWWPLVLIGFPFVGRVWCAVCPFMIYGEVTQKISQTVFKHQLKRWPREKAEHWGGWFLFGLFTLILLWEELWNLENTAYLSACLLLLITAGAMIFSALFERRFWCRYLCPIGGMNGMFAKLSMTELRAQQGICSAECTTYQCYKGGPEKGEGMATDGCPLYSHPAQLEDNRDCVLCMTCLKACPHRSVEFNLRPPGIELWTTHQPRSYEVALLFLLLGAVFLHHLPEIANNLGINWDLNNFWLHAGLSTLALAIPGLLALIPQKVMALFNSKVRNFVELAYGYLPLVLAANLAHYLVLFLGEAGRIIPVTFATFGVIRSNLPILVAHPAVITFLQGTTLIFGVIFSLILTQKIARQSWKLLLPQHLTTLIITIAIWQII